jgi:hypothetical protein
LVLNQLSPYLLLALLLLHFILWRTLMNPSTTNVVMVDLAVPLLRRLVAGFPLPRPGFNPGWGHWEGGGFVADKVTQVFS